MTRGYLCARSCGMICTQKLGRAMDRAPRPYTASELAEITTIPLDKVKAFLRRNTANDKICSRMTAWTVGEGRPQVREYWRGQYGLEHTFEVSNMMDERTESRLKQGVRPVSWRDSNHTNWSIDEAGTVAMMRGTECVRLGKAEAISYSKQGVTVKLPGTRITFQRQ